MEISPSPLPSWVFLSLLLLAFPLDSTAQPVGSVPTHLDTAAAYTGTVEPEGENMGPAVVRRSLESVGLGPGYPYCAAFVSWCLGKGDADRPGTRSALATDFLGAPRSIDATDVRRGAVTLQKGAVVVWRKGNGPYGHAGFAYHDDLAPSKGWENQCAHTIEANTSAPGEAGSQRDGEGIWQRYRCIVPSSYFRIVGFVPVH